MQRRVDCLLDDAEEAADRHDWTKVLECVRGVLSVDPGNQDELSLQTMAEAAGDIALDALEEKAPVIEPSTSETSGLG